MTTQAQIFALIQAEPVNQNVKDAMEYAQNAVWGQSNAGGQAASVQLAGPDDLLLTEYGANFTDNIQIGPNQDIPPLPHLQLTNVPSGLDAEIANSGGSFQTDYYAQVIANDIWGSNQGTYFAGAIGGGQQTTGMVEASQLYCEFTVTQNT